MKNSPRLMTKIGLTLTTILLSGLMAMVLQANAGEKGMDEYAVKAVYLLNFGKFSEWPKATFADPKQDIVLGLFGEDVFGDALDLIRDKKIQGRRLVIKKLGKGGDPQGCQILFISASEQRQLKQILSLLDGQPVLTVSDMRGFVEEGGIIGMAEDGGRIKIFINNRAAKDVGLILRAQLLNIATIVSKEE